MLDEIERNLAKIVDRLRGQVVDGVEHVRRVEPVMVWSGQERRGKRALDCFWFGSF